MDSYQLEMQVIVTYNSFTVFTLPVLDSSSMASYASSETVVKGTLSSPSGPSRKAATTGLFRSRCHKNLPCLRSRVTIWPLLVVVK